jgi:uncharacterized protein YeaO (DUF488 family)
MDIQTKRAYDPRKMEDGTRVLVDRVWPRGMTKEKLQAELWLKDIAPTGDLRKWFAHDPTRWNEFKKRYFSELDEKAKLVKQLCDIAAKGKLTLVYSARDTAHNQAIALKEYLMAKSSKAGTHKKNEQKGK